jgi:hypothetical protein
MKSKRIAFLSIIFLMGFLIVGTTTTEAKFVKFYFDGMEYMTGEIPPDKVWISEDLVMHIKGGAYIFYIAHEYFGLNTLIATTNILNIDLLTGLGEGNGGNYLTAVSFIPGFENLLIEMSGNSILKLDGFIYGWATSQGTIGEYKIHMKSEFGPVFENGVFVGTFLRGTLKIFV